MTSNRERFEEWYLAEFWEGSNGGRAMLKKEPCGGYTYAKPQELWKVWQAAQPAAGEPIAWIYEDELPEGYPYDAMFPFSKVDIVRMFPVFGPPAAAPVAVGEPIGEVELFGINMTYVEWRDRKMPPLGTKLFTAPPAAAGEPVEAKEIGEMTITLRDGVKCFSFEEYSEAYKLPEGLHYLYAAPPAAAHGDEAVRKDAERLDFILTKARKVTVEMLPRGRDVYVEEGVFGDRTYPAIHRDADWESGSPVDLAIKREAIDAAMRAQGDGEVQ